MGQVVDYFLNLFSPEGFPPRWYCGQWNSFTGWFYIFSDIAIWGAYFTIPIILLYFVKRRKDIPFSSIFLLFATFIVACGSTHLADAVMFWWPAYRLTGLIYFFTAIVSWATVIALVPVIPQVLAFKSPRQLEQVIQERTLDLQESQERLQTLADNVPTLVWMANADGWIFWYNKRWYDYTGTTLHQTQGWGWQSVSDPQELPNILEQWKASIKNGTVFDMVLSLKGADGIFRPFLTRIVPVRDAEGRIIRWFGANTEVTEQKKAREALEASNFLLNSINRIQTEFIATGTPWNLFDGIVQDTLTLTNSQFGYLGEVLYPESGEPYLVFRGLANTAQPPVVQELYGQLKTFGLELRSMETLFGTGLEQDGSVVISNEALEDLEQGGFPPGHPPITSFMGLPIYSEGKLVGQLTLANRPDGYTEDLAKFLQPLLATCGSIIQAYRNNELRLKAETELKKLTEELEERVNDRTEQLQTLNRELEAFSYSVSHDLRAPLRGVNGFSQALAEDYSDKLDERGKHYIDRIMDGSQQMGKLIDDMLQLSRVTRGSLIIEPVDLSLVAQEIIQELQEQEPERKVEFVIEPGIFVQGDKRLLQAVIQNLLDNAWKYTSKHETAQVEFGKTVSHGKLSYFVKDDGAGFDMKYSEKLFGAFQRLHGADEFPGTGVGLATAARIIHRHGGEIWAEGQVEQGATFYFTLDPNLREVQGMNDAKKQSYSIG